MCLVANNINIYSLNEYDNVIKGFSDMVAIPGLITTIKNDGGGRLYVVRNGLRNQSKIRNRAYKCNIRTITRNLLVNRTLDDKIKNAVVLDELL